MKLKKYFLSIQLLFISLIFPIISIEPSNQTIERKRYISYFLNSTVETLDDKNFDQVVLKGLLHDFIILFTVRKCDMCNYLITTLENVQKKYSNNSTNLKFGKVDIFMSGWTTMRFELEKIPNLIFVSNRSYAIYPYDNITEKDIINFIEDKNKEYKAFPKKMGYFDVFMKIFHIISGLIHERFPFWNESYSWLLVALFILFFCFIEYLIIKFCCTRKKKENQNKYGHSQYQHIHQHKTDKKFSKNISENKIKKTKME